jgi:hypothetical protein
MNRRALIRGIAVGGTASLAGCFLSGDENNDRNEAVATAHKELSRAVDILNKTELTVAGKLDISSQDFNRYSTENVTSHTKIAAEALMDDDSNAGDVLQVVTTVLEETAYQYEAIDGLFEAFTDYELHLYDNNYQNAVRASGQFKNHHTEVTNHGSTITENLALLKNKGYEEPVEGFSVQAWSQEQAVFVELSEAMRSLKYGFSGQARGLLRLRRASIERNNERYDKGLEEARIARDRFEQAKESFSQSVNRDITYRRALIKDFTCLSEKYIYVTDIGINALESYTNGDISEGDDLWQKMNKKLQTANDECSA